MHSRCWLPHFPLRYFDPATLAVSEWPRRGNDGSPHQRLPWSLGASSAEAFEARFLDALCIFLAKTRRPNLQRPARFPCTRLSSVPNLFPAADKPGCPGLFAQRLHLQRQMPQSTPQIAVLIPCLNEEAAVGKVVQDFHAVLPSAVIYVYDNGSVDRTAAVARQAGAIVRTEPLRGKGNVMRRMFADVEADVYVLVDGDDTYDAASAPMLVNRLLQEHIDMVNGARQEASTQAYRAGHRFGNRLLTGLVGFFFGERFTDILSGYRVMSRRFVKSFPALAHGFEIETELTVHALQLRLPIAEVATPYRDRPPASSSKLRTFPDGIRILRLIARMVREERPLEFFSAFAAVLAVTSIVLAIPVVLEYFRTGLVPRLPTAVLSTGLMLLSFLSLTCGMILATVTRGRIEAKRLRYLQIPAQRAYVGLPSQQRARRPVSAS